LPPVKFGVRLKLASAQLWHIPQENKVKGLEMNYKLEEQLAKFERLGEERVRAELMRGESDELDFAYAITWLQIKQAVEKDSGQRQKSARTTSQPNPNLPIVLHYTMRLTQVLASTCSLYLGYKLFILGVTGQASLSIESNTVSGQLTNAAPGLFFALTGCAGLIATIWRGSSVSIDKKNDDEYAIESKY
jgi:hypothetical protein